MSRKRQIITLLESEPRTMRELAQAMGVSTSLVSVYISDLRGLGLVIPVGEQENPARGRPVIVWGVVA